MSTTYQSLPNEIIELEQALPILTEKSKLGVIHFDSHVKAASLIQWAKAGKTLTDKQKLLVGRLLQRAKRKHKKVDFSATTVNTDSLVQQVIEKIGEQKVDLAAVIAAVAPKVMAAMEARTPRKVEVTVTKADGKKHVVKGAQHAKFTTLLRAATCRMSNGMSPGIFLQGEASSGKSTAGKMLAEALGLKWHFNGAISFPHEMLGFIDGAGKYHRTPFREACEHGGVYTFDEADRSDPVALLAVNPHLAGDVATFPDKQIKRHKDCIIMVAANTWGLGADANYSGATKLDAAFLSRFPIRINWDIDPVLEEAIVKHPEWLARVRKARERARQVGLKVMIDTRIGQAGAALIEKGFTLDEAAEMTYLANLKPDQRKQLELIS